MPPLPTMAQTFRDAGYQAHAVGKLHVHPQNSRIGFDDVVLCEEGRLQFGTVDDYEIFLAERGYAGAQFYHGMGNNQYVSRPWHLPEDCHVTNWLTRQMVRALLDLAGVDIPETTQGLSMVGDERRDMLYGELGEDQRATRMVHDGRYS
jgi:hypothetical protein